MMTKVEQQQKQPKKAKTTKDSGSTGRSKIFEHFRSIGLITGDTPFSMQSRGGICFLTTSIGRTFHIYNVDSLGLLFVGPELDGKICAIASHEDDTFAATETGSLYRIERAIIKEKIKLEEPTVSIQVLGENLLVLGKTGLTVMPLNLKKVTMSLGFGEEATFMLHPHTYLNKVVVGFKKGPLELWNFSTGKRIHQFSCMHSPSAVTAFAQAPVVDVIAVGQEDGLVSLVDLRKDQVLFSLKAKSSVTSISFRSDAAAESKPQMAVGSEDGLISIWNLETKNMEHSIDAHENGITSLFFLPGQPILVSAGKDNALKEWIFEFEECRLLRSRTGHNSPPALVRFYSPDGFSILSGGGDDRCLRMSSILKDSQSHELSQGSLESKAKQLQVKTSQLKLTPITAMDFFTAKELKWDNLITAHTGSSSARTWRVDNKTVGENLLKSTEVVTAVAMSPCGNFGLLGNAKGRVDVFNVQSGQHRRTFQCQDNSSIMGLAIDQFNKELLVITSTGSLTIFDFNKPSKILHNQELPGHVESFAFKPDNGLVALAFTKRHQIEIFDMEARRTVRRLAGHTGQVKDMSFSMDGKWLISCSSDGTIRTWDLPSGLTLDSFSCQSCPLSVSFSPTGDYLVSSHQDDLALHLWYNKTILSPLRLDSKLQYAIAGQTDNIQTNIIRLSSQPKSKWISLFHLEGIKARNRPIMPDAAPQKAPFFLDAAIITGGKRDAEGERVQQEANGESKQLHKDDLRLEALLASGGALEYLANAGASLVHLEIASLPENVPTLSAFLAFILAQIQARTDFELVQTYLSIFLKVHHDFVRENRADFGRLLAQIKSAQEETWGALEALLQQSLCLTAFCRDRY